MALLVGVRETCRANSVSAAAAGQFLDWTRASCLSSAPSVPSKTSLSPLEPLPCGVQHVESWSHWSTSPAAFPLPCELPVPQRLSSSVGLPAVGKQNASLFMNDLFLVCIHSHAYIHMHMCLHTHTCVFIRSNW